MTDTQKMDGRHFSFRLEPNERQPLFTHGSPAEVEVEVDGDATLIFETDTGELGLRTLSSGDRCRVIARRLHVHAENGAPVAGRYRLRPLLSDDADETESS